MNGTKNSDGDTPVMIFISRGQRHLLLKEIPPALLTSGFSPLFFV